MLMVLTVASAAAAIALAFYVWHLVDLDRLRSNARVTALAAAIEGTSLGDGTGGMFARDAASGLHGRPLLKVAIGFGMAVALIVLIAMTTDRRSGHSTAAIEGAVAPLQSLELLSMRHERDADNLIVTGLVRNPGAPAAGDIMAVVLAFDRDGGFIASGRAPLEFGRIAGGDESPFRVTVPGVRDVGRYRVSFRTESGVVRHVDRRPASSGLVSGRSGTSGSQPRLAGAE